MAGCRSIIWPDQPIYTSICQKIWNCWWLISWKAFFNSSASTKFVPLSDVILLTLPCLAMNYLSAKINESVFIEFVISIFTALLAWHVKIQPDLFLTLFYDKWTKHIITVGERRWISNSLSWKFCHLLCTKLPLNTKYLPADYTFFDDTFFDTVSIYYPETQVS